MDGILPLCGSLRTGALPPGPLHNEHKPAVGPVLQEARPKGL